MTTSFDPPSFERMTQPPMVGNWRPRSTPSTMITSLCRNSLTELVAAGTPIISSNTWMELLQ